MVIVKSGLGLLFHIYVRTLFCVNLWMNTYGICCVVFLYYSRDGKNMCLCSSCGQRRLFERQY